jgi:hypothetical protein
MKSRSGPVASWVSRDLTEASKFAISISNASAGLASFPASKQEGRMPGRRLDMLTLSDAEKSELTAVASWPKTAQALAQRARIVLACADGLENKAVARLSRYMP